MGNIGSTNNSRRNRQNHPPPPPPPPQEQPQPEITADEYIFAAATPLASQSPSPTNQSPPQSDEHTEHHHLPLPAITVPLPPLLPEPAPIGEWYPYGFIMPNDTTCVEQQKAQTIINDVNLKKETLRVVPDQDNPGKFLVTFTFDAIAEGSVTVMFYAKEGRDYILTPTIFTPVTTQFKQALGQIFKQPSGTGIDFSACEEAGLVNEPDMDVYPLVVIMDTIPNNQSGSSEESNTETTRAGNTLITYAMFQKVRAHEYQVRVLQQILYVNGMRYELQEIYGVGDFLSGDRDENDSGKECVICLSETRNTTALPCRHMCMCNRCARVLRFQTTKCPICRQPIERLLEIKVDYKAFHEGRPD